MRQDGGVGTRILTVEDDERIRASVKLALEDEGWVVVETDSGEQALESSPGRRPTSCSSTSCCPGSTGSRCAARSASRPTCRSSWSRPATTPTTSSPASRPVPTTTSPSRSRRRSCRPASAPCCAGCAPPTTAPASSAFGDLEILPDEGVVTVAGRQVHLTKTEFRLLVELGSSAGPGLQPRGAPRAGVGLRVLRRRPPRRRPHPAAAHQGRAGPRQPPPRGDGPGAGLQAPGVNLRMRAGRARTAEHDVERRP